MYNKYTFEHDIVIIELKTPIVFGEDAAPVAVPDQGFEVEDGTTCIVSGWGRLEYGKYLNVCSHCHVIVMCH